MTVLLKLQGPEGDLHELDVDPSITGNALKQRAHSIYRKRPDEQTLWFEMGVEGGDSSSKLVLVDDRKTLEGHGKTSILVVMVFEK